MGSNIKEIKTIKYDAPAVRSRNGFEAVESIAWAIRKNDPDFMKFLNDFLSKIRADGSFDKIYNKWFKSSD